MVLWFHSKGKRKSNTYSHSIKSIGAKIQYWETELLIRKGVNLWQKSVQNWNKSARNLEENMYNSTLFSKKCCAKNATFFLYCNIRTIVSSFYNLVSKNRTLLHCYKYLIISYFWNYLNNFHKDKILEIYWLSSNLNEWLYNEIFLWTLIHAFRIILHLKSR